MKRVNEKLGENEEEIHTHKAIYVKTVFLVFRQ